MTSTRQPFPLILSATLAFLLAIGTGLFWLDNERLTQDLATANEDVERLKADNARLQNRLSQMEQRTRTLRTSLDSFNEQQGSLAEVAEELRRELASVTTDYQRLVETQQDTQGRLEAARERLTRIGDLEDTRDSLREEQDRLVTRLERAESQNAALRQQLNLYATNIEAAQTALRSQQSQVDTLENRLNREQAALTELQQQLDALGDEKQALIQQLDNGTTVIKLPERILFETGSAVLNERAETALAEVARAIDSFPDYTIAVLGHSDSRPVVSDVKETYPTNWELSSARASAAVRKLIDYGVAADRLKATGLADTRPLVPEVDADSRRENRRIEVVLEPPLFTRELSELGS